MTRFFVNNNKFHKRLPSSFSEGEFEKVIILQAPSLYPDYYVFPFKMTVKSSSRSARPDLVFVAKDYNDWYIVEVEMSYHSFETHIEPQIDTLATAQYDDDNVIKYMCKQCADLDSHKLSKLVRTEPPKILLVLNEPNDKWIKELSSKYGVITTVFEVYYNSNKDLHTTLTSQAYAIYRKYPILPISITTKCSVHPHLSYLGVEDNSELQLKPNDQIILEFDGCATFWKVQQGPDNTIWLIMDGRNSIVEKNRVYSIAKLRDNSLFLYIN